MAFRPDDDREKDTKEVDGYGVPKERNRASSYNNRHGLKRKTNVEYQHSKLK